jgi:hypothetical protein
MFLQLSCGIVFCPLFDSQEHFPFHDEMTRLKTDAPEQEDEKGISQVTAMAASFP